MTHQEVKALAGHRAIPPWIMKLVSDAIAIEVAREREECAKVCIEHGKVWGERMLLGFQATLDEAAEAIRARGENK